MNNPLCIFPSRLSSSSFFFHFRLDTSTGTFSSFVGFLCGLYKDLPSILRWWVHIFNFCFNFHLLGLSKRCQYFISELHYNFLNFSCRFLLFFPIWILIVLLYQIWEISRNKLKSILHKSCTDLSLWEKLFYIGNSDVCLQPPISLVFLNH